VDMGFRSEGVATVAVSLRPQGYTSTDAAPFIRNVLDAARARPGVQHVGAATRVPIETDAFIMPIIITDGAAAAGDGAIPAAGDAPRMPLVGITPGYFETIGLEIVAGRGIEWADADGARSVAVITENAARRL